MRLGLAAAALGFLCMTGSVVCAQGPGGGMDMGPHRPPMEREMGPRGEMGRFWNNPRIVEKFKLTDTQRKAMDDIYEQHRLTLVDLHATLEKAELILEPMIASDQPDEAKILAQIDKVAQARAELEKANARMLLGLRRQLTPDQWKELRTSWAARRDGGRDGQAGPGGDHHWRSGGPGGTGPGGPPPGGHGAPGAGTPPASPGPGPGPGENE